MLWQPVTSLVKPNPRGLLYNPQLWGSKYGGQPALFLPAIGVGPAGGLKNLGQSSDAILSGKASVGVNAGEMGLQLSPATTDYATVADSALLDGFKSLTLTARFYLRSYYASDARVVLNKCVSAIGSFTDPYVLYQICVTSAGKLFFAISSGASGSRVALTSATTIALNTWYWVVCTYDGATIRAYINGVQDANTASTTLTIGSNTNPVLIGRFSDNGTYIDLWDGFISQLGVFGSAWSDAQVAAFFGLPWESFETLDGAFGAGAGPSGGAAFQFIGGGMGSFISA